MKYETPNETQTRELHGEAQFAGSIHLEAGARIIERETQARVAQGETLENAAKLAREALTTKEARTAAIAAFRAAEPDSFLPEKVISTLMKHRHGATEVFKHVVRKTDNARHFARQGNAGNSGIVAGLFGKKGSA